jgi:hypothetical protein
MFFCVALLYAIVSYAITVKDCGAGKGLFTINSLSVNPVLPSPGENVTMGLGYTVPLGATVDGGTASYAVTYNFIPLTPTTESLCKNVPCPIGPGTYTNESTAAWPTGLSGSIVIKMTWKDSLDRLLLCTQTSGTV